VKKASTVLFNLSPRSLNSFYSMQVPAMFHFPFLPDTSTVPDQFTSCCVEPVDFLMNRRIFEEFVEQSCLSFHNY